MPQPSVDPANSIHDVMCAEHVRLDGIFTALYRALEGGDRDAARPLFETLRRGLTDQGQTEETLLIPLILERGSVQETKDAERSREETARVLDFLEEAGQALDSDAPDAVRRTIGVLSQLMSVRKGHDRNRDRCLYPVADRVATPAEHAEILQRIQTS